MSTPLQPRSTLPPDEPFFLRPFLTRRLPLVLWERVQAHADSIEPRTTDTAIMELALREYLDRHEPKRAINAVKLARALGTRWEAQM